MKRLVTAALFTLLAAAALGQVDSAKAHRNVCFTAYNNGIEDVALAECTKAIQLDPTNADAYFVKASVLFGQSPIVNGVAIMPQGTTALLRKYLELAPDGGHAADVKAMLAMLADPKQAVEK